MFWDGDVVKEPVPLDFNGMEYTLLKENLEDWKDEIEETKKQKERHQT